MRRKKREGRYVFSLGKGGVRRKRLSGHSEKKEEDLELNLKRRDLEGEGERSRASEGEEEKTPPTCKRPIPTKGAS